MEGVVNTSSFSKKFFITICILVIYSILNIMPLIGANLGEGDPFLLIRVIGASTYGTYAELGILPVLFAQLILFFVLKQTFFTLDKINFEDYKLFQNGQRMLSILITLVVAVFISLSRLYGTNLDFLFLFSIIIQLTLAGTLIIFLVDLLDKEWGRFTGISIFLASGISLKIFQGFIAPNNILEGPEDITSARGFILAFLYWIGETGPIKAVGYLFFRYSTNPNHRLNLPALSLFSISLAIICFFLVIVIASPRNSVEKELSKKKKHSFSPVLPIVLTMTTLAFVRLLSLLLWNISGRENSSNLLLQILGTFRLDTVNGQYISTGGLVYFFSPSYNILEGLLIDPLSTIFQMIIYGIIFLWLYLFFSKRIIQLIPSVTDNNSEIQFETNWYLIGILCVLSDFLNFFFIGSGIILLGLILMNFYSLDPSGTVQISSRKFWFMIIVIGFSLFLLRIVGFVILGITIDY